MNTQLNFIKIVTLMFALLFTTISIADTISNLKHITVVNDSELTLLPTAAGLSNGCLGGSLPPFFKPIAPHSTRDIGLVFFQYLPTCSFDVLPEPHIITYLQSCHSVKANATVIYTGKDLRNLRCQVQQGR